MKKSAYRSRKFYYKKLVLASLAFYLLLQIPFIHADPHQFIYFGRDAFTDEALNLNQSINLVESGKLSFPEGDNLIKTPLFNLQQLPALLLHNSRESSRIWLMLILSGLLILIARTSISFALFIPFYLFLGLLQYDSFQYFRFSMPEAMCSLLILYGLALLNRWISEPRRRSKPDLFVIHLVFALACWEKNQYLYGMFIPSLVFLFLWLKGFSERKVFLQSVLINSGFVIFYLLLWYLPNRDEFHTVMGAMLQSRFIPAEIFFSELNENLKRAFLSSHEIWFTLIFLSALVSGLLLSRRGRFSFRTGFFLLTLWFLVELHKLGIRWVPSRYLISVYFVMGAIIAWVAVEGYLRFFRRKGNKVWIGYSFMVSLLIFCHSRNLLVVHEERSYVMSEIKAEMKKVDFGGRYAIGSWAPSLTWGAHVRTMPAWKGYLNDTDLIREYHPKLIITEHDEGDANGLYSARGIDLRTASDSVTTRQVGNWELKFYWFD